MILLPTTESFVGSGLVNMPFLNDIYRTIIDETFVDMGRTVTLHLNPEKTPHAPTQALPQPQRPNPFFAQRVPVPQEVTKNSGYKITPRDIQFTAHIRIGPLKGGDDEMGIGDLKDNQVATTLVIEALPYVKEAQACSIEGRRYRPVTNRPIGLTGREYVIAVWEEMDSPTIDNSEGAG